MCVSCKSVVYPDFPHEFQTQGGIPLQELRIQITGVLFSYCFGSIRNTGRWNSSEDLLAMTIFI